MARNISKINLQKRKNIGDRQNFYTRTSRDPVESVTHVQRFQDFGVVSIFNVNPSLEILDGGF